MTILPIYSIFFYNKCNVYFKYMFTTFSLWCVLYFQTYFLLTHSKASYHIWDHSSQFSEQRGQRYVSRWKSSPKGYFVLIFKNTQQLVILKEKWSLWNHQNKTSRMCLSKCVFIMCRENCVFFSLGCLLENSKANLWPMCSQCDSPRHASYMITSSLASSSAVSLTLLGKC